ncbi:hypothetical protein CIPAW_05G130800 [Carya illinoinensis]|uniref:Arabinanase/levansucrase/invertase n=1 Tax=Carya illinoinensis TaxID=32201 RepID=A0A8T1QI14_CARIL|nr:hypothetical protein CIPAW_05G130800 [Carya illinoinensis]
MDSVAVTGFKTISTKATNLIQSPWPSIQLQTFALHASSTSLCSCFPSHQRGSCPKSRNSTFLTQCSTKPSIDSNNATNKNPSIERDSSSKSQNLATPVPNQAVTSTSSSGDLVLDLGPKNSWDSAEIGSPAVKRYIGDNEERWCMWYHGRSDANNTSDSVGLAISSNGIHWARGADHVRSCGDVGLVMNCSNNWWAFDTESIRPSEIVVMSSPIKSSQGDDKIGKIFRSLPGLVCSQDGRHWARIEGDHHNKEWDSLFIAAPHVFVHRNDDLRMYYHSFDTDKGHFALGIARSRDGIRWVKVGKIMLGVKNACVVRNRKEGNYLMAYEGVSAGGKSSIGLTVSPDGLKNWMRLQGDPIVKPSEEDGWDNKGVGSPCLVQMEDNEDKWRLYYVGVGYGGRTGIGMTVSEGSHMGNFRRWVGSHL